MISSRLIEFWCFGLPAALGVGGWVDGGGGWLEGAPHTCAHARTCMHGKHDNSMQMGAPSGFGEIPGIPYDVMHACVRVHMCGGTLSTPPTPIDPPTPIHTPPPPRVGDPQNQSKFNST